VDLVSTNAARIMGLYPRKGAITVGSDADITILDPTRRGKVRAADLHETDYTPWEGHDIFAWPVMTMLRGKVMVENGKYFGTSKDGQYLKRKIAAGIRNGPAL
ncbi:MAG TPA: amidohydrolase family protein, partial [Xanthobacteraceae bacterium]|jgi:dihydropyrimidinase